jgi:DNA uptake protein ComE-like DNA-binding protein
MNFFESHFWYNKRQRNGILLMALMITGVQTFLYFSDDLFGNPAAVYDPAELEAMNASLDSLLARKKPDKQRTYPFNPNYMTDFKGYVLGMSPEEIDRLLHFRAKGQFLRSARDFQAVTGVSDSLLRSVSPYFKFPAFQKKNQPPSNADEKADLNLATEEDFRKIRGVGEILSKRIVAYRSLLGGFSLQDQLYEVYKLPEETAKRVLSNFEIRTPPVIERINVNTASFKEILSLPYIDYDLTRRIMAFRNEEKVITDLSDLKKIDSFPLDKFERIAVYLLAE